MQAAIFDMDGLLIDSEPLWRRAEQEVFLPLGLSLSDEDCATTTGMRIDEVVRHWHRRQPWQDRSVEQVSQDILSRVGELIAAEGEELAGVRATLERLDERGIRLAVASSSPRQLIDAVLERLGISDCFEGVFSATEEAFGKPHPAVYLSAARSLEVEPGECLAFEDSAAGVRSAKAAGMTVIAVPTAADFDDPAFDLADLKIASLEEFPIDAIDGIAIPATPSPGLAGRSPGPGSESAP